MSVFNGYRKSRKQKIQDAKAAADIERWKKFHAEFDRMLTAAFVREMTRYRQRLSEEMRERQR